MKFRVFDTEGVGLNHKATKLHNFCYTEDGTTFNYTTDYDEMREWLSHEGVIWVCHNLICHDWPAIKAVLGVEMSYKQAWDTLALSWALFPDRPKHGLEALGKEHGVEKVAVEEHEWEIGDPVKMRERVETDVLINYLEFQKQKKRLEEIYDSKNNKRVA